MIFKRHLILWVDHSILLAKLYNYGVRGNVYNWFKDYLYDRQQFVSVRGINSDTVSVSCGVPRGSVLGPLLFLIYVNDMYSYWEKFHLVELNILVQNSSKTTKKFFTFDVSTSIRGLHQKKLVLGLLLPVLGAIS